MAKKSSGNKIKRVQDRELIEFIKKNCPCICCGILPTDAHHVRTKKAGGDDTVFNLMPLCRGHHIDMHAAGLTRMSEKYDSITTWLTKAGYAYDGFRNKWIYEGDA